MLVGITWGGLTNVFIVATFCITFERVYNEIYCETIANILEEVEFYNMTLKICFMVTILDIFGNLL